MRFRPLAPSIQISVFLLGILGGILIAGLSCAPPSSSSSPGTTTPPPQSPGDADLNHWPDSATPTPPTGTPDGGGLDPSLDGGVVTPPNQQPDGGQPPAHPDHDAESPTDTDLVDAGLMDVGLPDGGTGRVDWPHAPEPLLNCLPPASLDPQQGIAWEGWANLQHPPTLATPVSTPSDLLYGQVWRAGSTDLHPSPDSSWQAEILLGPYGDLPGASQGCWTAQPAEFNAQVGNNHEYMGRITPGRSGLYSLFFRFRPQNTHRWLVGDLNGSLDGLQRDQAALLAVAAPPQPAPLVVVTFNLQCTFDNWEGRLPRIVSVLTDLNPDIIGFQEDCSPPHGVPQSEVIRNLLGPTLNRGYVIHREVTHQAENNGQYLEEGISIMSAHDLESVEVLSLPYAIFPRKAIVVDVTIRGAPLRVLTTHLDYGRNNQWARTDSAQMIVEQVLQHPNPVIITGDLNDVPESPPLSVLLTDQVVDAWVLENSDHPGHTHPASGPTRRIDYILVSSNAASQVHGAKLLAAGPGEPHLSDHLGVAVLLQWPKSR